MTAVATSTTIALAEPSGSTRAKVKPQIRIAEISDIPKLYSIINAAYRTRKSWTTEFGLVRGDRITMDELHILITEARDPILVAELPISSMTNTPTVTSDSGHEGDDQLVEVVGCISAEASHLHPQMKLPENSALIGLFSVSPDYQSRGIGSALFHSIIEHIRVEWKCRQAVLWVIQQRQDIQAWYERMGFRWNGDLRDFVFPDKAMYDDIKFKVLVKDIAEI